MITSIFLGSGGDFKSKIISLLIMIPCVLMALTFHEFAHGFVASKCGDNTAKNLGRLTLNPLYHLDIFGTIMMLFVGFGWAKPVPVNPRNFRKPRRDMAIVALAGPVANLLLALIGAFLCGLTKLIITLFIDVQVALQICVVAYDVFSIFTILNIGLAVFNLIPLPPLDGSNILTSFLPPMMAAKYQNIRNYTRYIFLGIILLTWLPEPFSVIYDWMFFPVSWLRITIYNGFIGLFDILFGLFV